MQKTKLDHFIEYLTKRNKNVVLFIHGFNVAAGELGKQVESIELAPNMKESTSEGGPSEILQVNFSSFDQTIIRTSAMLEYQFPILKIAQKKGIPFPLSLTNEGGLNGIGAPAWGIAMEGNLNRATTQFDRSDYSKYQRVMQIPWPGDVGLTNYIKSEEPADEYGELLAMTLAVLIKKGLAISIIAHSMGNRVVMRALESLAGLPEYHNKIVSFWMPRKPFKKLRCFILKMMKY